MKTARAFLLFVTAIPLTVPMFGTTIVSDVYSSGSTGSTHGWEAVTWTQTGTYNNVTIGANLATDNGLSTSTGTAYLMTQLGPGTTAANEVTTPFAISVSGNPGLNNMTQLFSHLTLGPGTYYLLINPTSINAPDSLDWDRSNPTLRTLDTGVTQGSDLTLSGSVASFPPASSSVTSTNSVSLIFSVTGDPTVGVPSTTPEPSSIGMMLAGLAGLWLTVRKRITSRR